MPHLRWVELKVPPLLVWLICAGAMFGVARLAPGFSYTLPARSALALTLAAFGGAVAVLLLPLFPAYMTQYQIKPEERALLAKFGPELARYMARVRRWV